MGFEFLSLTLAFDNSMKYFLNWYLVFGWYNFSASVETASGNVVKGHLNASCFSGHFSSNNPRAWWFSLRTTLCKKYPYSELFWSTFSHIRNECGLCIQSKCGKTQTKITPIMDTFHAVRILPFSISFCSIFEDGYYLSLFLVVQCYYSTAVGP